MADPSLRGFIHNGYTTVGGDTVLWLGPVPLTETIVAAVESWVGQYGTSNIVQKNLAKFVRLRPEGLPPHMAGVSVIA